MDSIGLKISFDDLNPLKSVETIVKDWDLRRLNVKTSFCSKTSVKWTVLGPKKTVQVEEVITLEKFRGREMNII